MLRTVATPASTARLDWLGCATFRLRTAEGLTIFLDAYLDRVPHAAQSGFGIDDVTEAEWILVGHSHFDHLFGAERIAARTGATVVGSYESVRVLAAAGVPEEQMIPVSGGEHIVLDAATSVRVLPGLHSCTWTDRPMPEPDEVCLGDLGVPWHERTRRLRERFWPAIAALGEDVRAHLEYARQGDRGDGGVLIYVIETTEGSLLFQDTVGCWTPLMAQERPDVAILAAAGRGNRNGEPVQTSTAAFVAEQAALLQPKRIVPCHHDDWLPGFSVAIDTGPIHRELAAHAPGSPLVDLGYASAYPLFA
jgi:L-ascorbate metabolism protein UlaG (beta-lactamase superfamily)